MINLNVLLQDYFPYLLACLQSGEETIKRTIVDCIKMKGFAPLAATALKKIDYLSIEPSENGMWLLAFILNAAKIKVT